MSKKKRMQRDFLIKKTLCSYLRSGFGRNRQGGAIGKQSVGQERRRLSFHAGSAACSKVPTLRYKTDATRKFRSVGQKAGCGLLVAIAAPQDTKGNPLVQELRE